MACKMIKNSYTYLAKAGAIEGPKFPDVLVDRVFFEMQAYLTKVWRISFTRAAGIMNIWKGISLVSPLFLQFLADSFLGNLAVAVLSTLLSTLGLFMVVLSVPRLLKHYGGRCPRWRAEACHDHTQEALFYTGMVLIALGRGGISFSLDALHDDEINEDEMPPRWIECFLQLAVKADEKILHLTGSLLVLMWIRKWKLLFGILAGYSAWITFWFVWACIKHKFTWLRRNGSPIASVCRVLHANATSNEESPPLPDDHHRKPLFDRFPRLDKVLLLSEGSHSEGQDKDNPRRFKKEEIDTARYVVSMIPISITFILCGVVSSVGNTYFVEQASHMNRRVGRLKLPLLAIKLLTMYFEACHGSYLNCLFKREWFRKRFAMGVAMLYSVLCCITAARMEERRLRVVRRHGLVGKPDDVEVPMHVAWLLFQFFLLAGLDSCYRKSVEEFYKDHAPPHLKPKLKKEEEEEKEKHEAREKKKEHRAVKRYLVTAFKFVCGLKTEKEKEKEKEKDKEKEHRAMKRYLDTAVNFVGGLGFFLSVLLVYVVGEWSDGWFQYTLNKSHLDRYYWLLAGLSAVNLLVFEIVVTAYPNVQCVS